MLATHKQRQQESAAFSSTFKQQAKKLFSVDSLLDSEVVGLHGTKAGRINGALPTGEGTISARIFTSRAPSSVETAVSQQNALLEATRGLVHGLDDILALFAQGRADELSVFFCRRVEESRDFRPYDLLVYPPHNPTPPLDPEYFTVSPSGVLHVRKGEAAELTTLAAWTRERTLFTFLRRIPFFKHYILIRCFTRWHLTTRRLLFQRIRAQVGQQLLSTRPQFRSALLDVRRHLLSLDEVAVLALGPPLGGGAWQLNDFRDVQADVRERHFERQLTEIAKNIQTIVQGVVGEVENRLSHLQSEADDEQTRSLRPDTRSLYLVKKERMEHGRQRKLADADRAGLGGILRLVDYWMNDALAVRMSGAVQELYRALRPADLPDFEGLIMTSVAFRGETRVLMPDQAVTLTALNDSILDAALNVANAMQRPLSMREFAPYFDGRPTSLHLPTVLWGSKEYETARKSINDMITGDFVASQDWAKVFDSLRIIHDFGSTWNFQQWAAQPRGVQQLRRELKRHADWNAQLEAMKTGATMGSLHVEANGLKLSLKPIIATAHTQVKGQVLQMAREAANRCLVAMRAHTATLKERDNRLAAFCDYIVMHLEQEAGKKALMLEAAEADEMFNLLLLHKDKLSPADQVLRDDLVDMAEAYVAALTAGTEHIESNKMQQVEGWGSEAGALHRQSAAVLSDLQTSRQLHDPQCRPPTSLDRLNELATRLARLREDVDAHAALRNPLGMDAAEWELEQLTDAEQLLGRLRAMWQTLAKLDTNMPEWTGSPLRDLATGLVTMDAEAIQSSVDDAVSVLQSSERKLRGFEPVVELLRTRLDEAQGLLPLLLPLTSKALRDRHWEQIIALLSSEQRGQDEWDQFSMNDLVEAGINEHLHAVDRIAQTAAQEVQLERELADMDSAWADVRVMVVLQPDSPAADESACASQGSPSAGDAGAAPGGVLRLGEIRNIQSLLQRQQGQLREVQSSPYAAPIAAQVTGWQAILGALKATADTLNATQKDCDFLDGRVEALRQARRSFQPEESLLQAQAGWFAVLKEAAEAPSVLHLLKASTWGQQLQGVAASLLIERAKLPQV